MAVDNTHTKYLKGTDKKAWNGYKEAYEASQKLQNFMDSFAVPDIAEGEEIEIPVRGNRNKKK